MHLASDIRFALRNLSKAPVFSAVAVLSLAFGIGANTAIFSLIDQLMLRLLPVKNPAELVLLDSDGNHLGNNRGANASRTRCTRTSSRATRCSAASCAASPRRSA